MMDLEEFRNSVMNTIEADSRDVKGGTEVLSILQD